MKMLPPSETLDWYDRNAADYVERTANINMEGLYGPFLELVPPGGHILDAGCGSGRDTLEFKRRGYTVTAIDGAPELAALASARIGQSVGVVRFEELPFEEVFDGIWASASLLHVPKMAMSRVIERFARALKPGGVWYMSFKQGEGEEVEEGRFFSRYEVGDLRDLLAGHPALAVLNVWKSSSLVPGRSVTWLNALVRKKNADGT